MEPKSFAPWLSAWFSPIFSVDKNLTETQGHQSSIDNFRKPTAAPFFKSCVVFFGQALHYLQFATRWVLQINSLSWQGDPHASKCCCQLFLVKFIQFPSAFCDGFPVESAFISPWWLLWVPSWGILDDLFQPPAALIGFRSLTSNISLESWQGGVIIWPDADQVGLGVGWFLMGWIEGIGCHLFYLMFTSILGEMI